jgi:histone H3/H4
MIPFNIIKKVAKNNKIKLSERATRLLQKMLDELLVDVIKSSFSIAKNDGRVIILNRDVKLTLKLKGLLKEADSENQERV